VSVADVVVVVGVYGIRIGELVIEPRVVTFGFALRFEANANTSVHARNLLISTVVSATFVRQANLIRQ
jgi:hypothetical protein